MELKDLIGKRVLTGVDFEEIAGDEDNYYENSSVCRFCLDGVVYVAAEDPSDGYRSCMKDITVSENAEIKNSFEGVEVLAIYVSKEGYDDADILSLLDTATAKEVLRVGTRNTDDYYPCYVANFQPENMAINIGK